MSTPVWETPQWIALKETVPQSTNVHLRDLLADTNRNKQFSVQSNGIYMDFSRQRATCETLDKLLELANKVDISGKIKRMYSGEVMNMTENRSVLHVALRAKRNESIEINGVNQVNLVYQVRDHICDFSQRVRSGAFKGVTGENLTNVISIGIGGSYLGAEFVAEALKTDPIAEENARGRTLRFYANVDPLGFARAVSGLNPANTLAVIISKTFTTRETMMNARFVRDWFVQALGDSAPAKHIIAVSANPDGAVEFGINRDNVFGFWPWVGGRYSVTSAVGVVPLSLHYGYDVVEQFLDGANDIDRHFAEAPLDKNIPVLLGLFGIWNSTFLGYGTRALIPYCESLNRLPAHIQQLDMESNGKGVTENGDLLPFDVGEIDFGEPGTNAQHSFFQLIHQGRVVPVDFIGFVNSQLKGTHNFEEHIANSHDELMSNFFAQCDALALGKTDQEVRADGVPDQLVSAKVFTGNRPSTILLLDRLNAFTVGQLLSIFEHRTAVQGWIWGINSFDQWGVELGKVLGKKVGTTMQEYRENKIPVNGYNSATTAALNYYLSQSSL